MNVQFEMIGAMIREDDPELPVMAGITPEILSPEAGRAYEFVIGFFREYRKMPGLDTVKECLQLELPEKGEPLEFYVDKVCLLQRTDLLRSAMQEASKVMDSPNEIVAKLTAGLAACRKMTGRVDDAVDLTKNIDHRLKDYDHRAELFATKKVDGYNTPWAQMDEMTWGVHAGELWTLAARLGTGKTWALTLFVYNWFVRKVPVLMVSMEMTPDQIAKRFDALFCSVAHSDLRKGQLSKPLRKAYEERLMEMKKGPPLIVVGSGRCKTVEDVEALVSEYSPAVVAVDGVYLLNPDPNQSPWERVGHTMGTLKRMCLRRKIGGLGTTQLNRKVKSKHLDAGMDTMAFGDAIGYDSDIVVGMFQDPDMRRDRTMMIRLLKNREDDKVAFVTNWDLTTNNFSVIHQVSEEEAGQMEVAEPKEEKAIDF